MFDNNALLHYFSFYLFPHIEIVNASAGMHWENLDSKCHCFFQEREEKIRAEAALTHSLFIPFDSAQCSYDNPPTFSMDDFEGILYFFASSIGWMDLLQND